MTLSTNPDPHSRRKSQLDAFDKALKDFPVGSFWIHSGGGEYKVIGIERDATGYEQHGAVATVVRYEQQYEGLYPLGTIWVREIEDFKSNFSLKT